MDIAEDGRQVAASLSDRLGQLTFMDLTADEVTARIIEAVSAWADGQGWRVYRRAPSVMPLPAPLSRQHSVIDVACARPGGPPVVVEVDRTDRRRTLDKLAAEADAGRIPIWVRWGTGPFATAPPQVHLVGCEVTHRHGPIGQGRLHTRMPVRDRPPPEHSVDGPRVATAVALPLPSTDLEAH